MCSHHAEPRNCKNPQVFTLWLQIDLDGAARKKAEPRNHTQQPGRFNPQRETEPKTWLAYNVLVLIILRRYKRHKGLLLSSFCAMVEFVISKRWHSLLWEILAGAEWLLRLTLLVYRETVSAHTTLEWSSFQPFFNLFLPTSPLHTFCTSLFNGCT